MKIIQGWVFPIPENLLYYFFAGGAGAGFSGAGAGASAGFGFSAGFSGAFLQAMLSENDTTSISDRSMAKNFFINCHLLSGNT